MVIIETRKDPINLEKAFKMMGFNKLIGLKVRGFLEELKWLGSLIK